MPGIVVFNRRWAVGSDDLVVPGIFLCVMHTVWVIVLSTVLATYDFGGAQSCVSGLYEHLLGYVVILCGCILVEASIAWVSLRGTILETAPRASMHYLLYIRLGVLFVEIGWQIFGVIWLSQHYHSCPIGSAKDVTLGLQICNICVFLSVLVTIWCTFDAAGRSWVKMKNYQKSLKDSKTKFNYKRSGSLHRDWRHRKVVRAYQESWNTRCRLLFCCAGKHDQHRNSFTEIAHLLSDFFRDLDVVPSDVVAGLVLLRQQQRKEKSAIVAQKDNDTYEFLSGIPITPRSRFLALHDPEILEEFKTVIHYMRYALAVYGWPMYIKGHAATGLCRLCPYLRCCCCLPFCRRKNGEEVVEVVEDNCCQCNRAAMCQMLDLQTSALVYVSYHLEVGETPFFVAVDHKMKTIVVSIRGTLSLKDVITDLNAEGEQLPVEPQREEWIGHKGMVQAAEYIRKKLRNDMILSKAFGYDTQRGTQTYDIALVGHSLGAGTAAILAILLKPEFPNLHCYAYSPPGGLLSMPAVEYTKSFITSVVVGKDVIPRIGLHQMEALRSDLINAIKCSQDPKWKVIATSFLCCNQSNDIDPHDYNIDSFHSPRDVTSHPSDSNIALTVHQPLYPPGKIIHIVRHHPNTSEKMMKKTGPVYQALWAENTDFDKVLISPVMVQDHMPDKVLKALQKVLSNVGPPKPQRAFRDQDRRQLLPESPGSPPPPERPLAPHKLLLETSFTDLNPGSNNSICIGSMPEAPTAPSSASMSWECSLAFEDQLNYHWLRNHRARLTPQTKINVINDDWIGFAPLATPETLSDVSSVSSKGSVSRMSSLRFSNRMTPINDINSAEQPLLCVRNKMNDCEEYFNENSHLLSDPTAVELIINDDVNHMVTEAIVEIEAEQRIPLTSEIIMELESDSEGPNYEGGRLSFDLSQETSASRTSDDTGYHGDLDVFLTNSPKTPFYPFACHLPQQPNKLFTNPSSSSHVNGKDVKLDQTEVVPKETPDTHPHHQQQQLQFQRQPQLINLRHDSGHSVADTISDFSSNPSPLISPESVNTCGCDHQVVMLPPQGSQMNDKCAKIQQSQILDWNGISSSTQITFQEDEISADESSV
ncbi:hypothetical protein CHUAL_005379 [Chamberlinius hualienensis]